MRVLLHKNNEKFTLPDSHDADKEMEKLRQKKKTG